MVKRTNLKQITLKKSKTLFHKERIAPVTLDLKTFSLSDFTKRAMGAKEWRAKVRKCKRAKTKVRKIKARKCEIVKVYFTVSDSAIVVFTNKRSQAEVFTVYFSLKYLECNNYNVHSALNPLTWVNTPAILYALHWVQPISAGVFLHSNCTGQPELSSPY